MYLSDIFPPLFFILQLVSASRARTPTTEIQSASSPTLTSAACTPVYVHGCKTCYLPSSDRKAIGADCGAHYGFCDRGLYCESTENPHPHIFVHGPFLQHGICRAVRADEGRPGDSLCHVGLGPCDAGLFCDPTADRTGKKFKKFSKKSSKTTDINRRRLLADVGVCKPQPLEGSTTSTEAPVTTEVHERCVNDDILYSTHLRILKPEPKNSYTYTEEDDDDTKTKATYTAKNPVTLTFLPCGNELMAPPPTAQEEQDKFKRVEQIKGEKIEEEERKRGDLGNGVQENLTIASKDKECRHHTECDPGMQCKRVRLDRNLTKFRFTKYRYLCVPKNSNFSISENTNPTVQKEGKKIEEEDHGQEVQEAVDKGEAQEDLTTVSKDNHAKSP